MSALGVVCQCWTLITSQTYVPVIFLWHEAYDSRGELLALLLHPLQGVKEKRRSKGKGSRAMRRGKNGGKRGGGTDHGVCVCVCERV